MSIEQTNTRRQFHKKGWLTGLAIVILAAVLLEGIAAIQYNYTRGVLERNLEKQVLIILRASAMRLDGNLNATMAQLRNQIWHAQQHLDDPDYMETLVTNLVKYGTDRVIGAGVAFRPFYYPQKGRWFEPYANRQGSSISVEQIGSARHDYLQMEFYQTGIKGDTLKWTTPYMDKVGAKGEVTSYALPLRDTKGQTVAVLGIDVATGWINESLGQLRLHPSDFTLALTKEGSVVAAPADSVCSRALTEKIAAMITTPTAGKVERVDGTISYFKFRNEEKGRSGRVYYTQKRSEPKWILAKAVYDDEAFSELEKMQRNILLTLIVGLTVLGFIIYLFARNSRKLQDTLLLQQRTENELQIASNIQRQLLPIDEPSLQHVSEVLVEGRLIPAREVGGDLYNVFVRDGKLFFCIGDVSGKGVPSALIMSIVQTLFHNVALEENNPARIMERLNATGCYNNHSNMFVTLFIGVLDLKTGHLDYCNAGHERPLIDGKPLNMVHNMPLGLLEDFIYEMQETTIAPGETLTLYTDGLTEARNAQKQLFGRKGIMQLIARCSSMPPKEMVDAVITEVQRFAINAEQSDDLTMLAICYRPKKQ